MIIQNLDSQAKGGDRGDRILRRKDATSPLISVVMSCYNRQNYVAEAIESILNQTYSNFEFIIIDDCSSDNTFEIVQKYAKKDRRIIALQNEKNCGITYNRNKLHKLAKGKYIAIMDDDDISLPQRFEKQVKYMEENPDVAVVGSKIETFPDKQWGVKPEEIDTSVSARVPIYISRDDRYFQDAYQALPGDGYTKMIESILDHPLIEVRLKTDFKDIKENVSCDKLFYTGAIDEFFDYKFGKLPYRSLDIVFETYDKEYMQSCAQMNYPNNFDFTRSVEYKYYLDEKSDKTILSYEYPCDFKEGKNERYYPIPNDKNQQLYEKYLQEASKLENVYFLGRLGDYKYYDMDKTVDRALKFGLGGV